MSAGRSLGAWLALLAATPAAANDDACLAAAHDHTSFKAILSDDQNERPQYDTVKRTADGTVVITRFVDGQKRLVRTTTAGLLSTEEEFVNGAQSVRLGIANSVDAVKVVALSPNTSFSFTSITAPSDRLDPHVSHVTLTVGARHEAVVGGCRLTVVDLELTSRTDGSDIVLNNKVVFAPDLAYPVETSTQLARGVRSQTFVTRLRDIEPWHEGAEQTPGLNKN